MEAHLDMSILQLIFVLLRRSVGNRFAQDAGHDLKAMNCFVECNGVIVSTAIEIKFLCDEHISL